MVDLAADSNRTYSWAAAALLEEFKERCYSACFLHWCLASLVLPRLRPNHLAQALCDGLKEIAGLRDSHIEVEEEDGSLGLVASVACLGQAVLLDGPMAEVPPLCWSLLQQLLARFPAKGTERAETEEKEKDKEQWMSLAPGLQNWWLSELGLRPVERLSIVEEVLALVQSVAWAECTSLVPSYRGHILRPLLPDLQQGLRDLRPAGAGFLQADLEALQRMVAGGVLSADAAVVAIDGPWFSRQVGFVPALVSLFETMHKCFFERQVNLAMVRWALRRYVRSSFTRVAKEMQDRGADDAAMSKAFGQWLVENLQPLDQELGSAPGLPWLLEDLLSEHLVGDSVESRTWFLQQNVVFDARFDSLGPSLALLLRRVAADLPMRRVVEALIDTEATGPVAPTRQEAELLATCLETSLEPPKREAKEWKEPKEFKEPKDGKEWPQRKPRMSDLAEVLKCDLLSWGRCLRWFNSAQESLPDDLQDRLAKCIAPGKAGLQMLAEACEKGSLSVSALGQLVAGSDGGDALELAGLPGASAALQRWQKRLVEAGDTLQSLVESCKSLWPSDAKLHLAIGRVSEAWPELPAAMALRGLSGEEPRGPLAQVPRLLLLCSPALALLGTSGAFQALWTQGGCGQEFKEAELQLSAIAWAGFYTSLEKPEASDLRVVMLEPVLERLQQPEELRLMAVTGRSLRLEDGEVLSWTVSDPGDWETKAEALARRLWHGVSVKRAFGGLKKTLAQLKDKFLDAAGQKDADGLLAVLGELEPHFAEWEVTELKSSAGKMFIAINAVPNRTERYLSQTLASLLRSLSVEEVEGLRIEILSDEAFPELHAISAHSLEPLVQVVYNPSRQTAPTASTTESWRRAAVLHYLLAMERCFAGAAELCLVLDDDTLASEGWLSEVLQDVRFWGLVGFLASIYVVYVAGKVNLEWIIGDAAVHPHGTCHMAQANLFHRGRAQSAGLCEYLRNHSLEGPFIDRLICDFFGQGPMWATSPSLFQHAGRVDESKLSALTAVRTTLHDLIFRSSLRLPSLDALLQCLASLENSSEIPGLIHALNFAHSMHGPLSELLVGKDAALARMLQMLKPSSHARWVMSHRSASSAKDEEQEAAIPAEARLLHLALNSPGSESSAQRLVEILDFQASVTLAASTSDSAYGQVAAFNEQIGLVRLAAAVLDDLREAGHPDFQEIHVEWPLSMALAEMKQRLHALRERQGNWRKKLTELQQRCPVLGFFAARQLGALLRTLKEKNLAGTKQVLAAVAQGWRTESGSRG
ncbi:unnamed protein product [Effrenium voratum]|nr:unnamed protein product [Effrenium voratum]